MRQITSNVYVEDSFSTPPKLRRCTSGFVITSEGIVIIDSPYMPSDAVKLREDLSKIGEVRYLINTHHHIDHITGNYFLPGTIVSHVEAREMLTAPVPLVSIVAVELAEQATRINPRAGLVDCLRLRVSQLDPDGLQIPKDYQLRVPTITFSQRLTLYVGRHTFELLHLPGHTPGHIGVYIPEEKVFFAGDNFTTGVQPSLAHSSPLDWIESLKKIEAMDIDVLVPGHGVVCGKEGIREFILFLEKVVEMVREAIRQGMSKEEAAAKLTFLGFYPSLHPEPGTQRMSIIRIYEILTQNKPKG
ncbi:MAG: MBL fold metallo-hydrolase [Chloroflexi bacterium]|nr:MBL fold metallo-hydrolase [Chloroflexota bacterium]